MKMGREKGKNQMIDIDLLPLNISTSKHSPFSKAVSFGKNRLFFSWIDLELKLFPWRLDHATLRHRLTFFVFQVNGEVIKLNTQLV